MSKGGVRGGGGGGNSAHHPQDLQNNLTEKCYDL